PTFTELGGGLYRANNTSWNAVGKVDLTTACSPRYQELDRTPGANAPSSFTGPSLTPMQPLPGIGTISSSASLQFTLVDPDDSMPSLDIVATYSSNQTQELIYSSATSGFSTLYQGSYYNG